MTTAILAAGEALAADLFEALINDCDVATASVTSAVHALASLTAYLTSRKSDSTRFAVAKAPSSHSALLARKTRVLGSARRLFHKHCKRIVAYFDAAEVSSQELRVWAAVALALAGPGTACPDLVSALALPLLASPQVLPAPSIGVASKIALPFDGELGSVSTGDRLRVVSAAGPGLRWFEPHSRNEFSVVLALADGIVPAWLTTGDVELLVGLAANVTPASVSRATATATMSCTASVSVTGRRTVAVVYADLPEDVPEVTLRITVCGFIVDDCTGHGNWCAFVRRRPFIGHDCAVMGALVRCLPVQLPEVEEAMLSLAVSADEKWLVVGCGRGGISVHSLPEGELVRIFAREEGNGPLQFHGLCRLCFVPNGHLIVVDFGNKRLQEVSLEGVFVRFVGAGEFGDSNPHCVAVHDEVIGVGCFWGTGPRVTLFDFSTGTVMSRFGEGGTAPGKLSDCCSGIRFTPDGSHIIVAETASLRVSVFTTAGVFVRCVGAGMLDDREKDVVQSVTGEYVVAEFYNWRVCVFSPDGSELVRSFGISGVHGSSDEVIADWYPVALATAGQHLYVMEQYSDIVRVFL